MYLEELQVGAEYPIESVTIEKEKMLDFARLYDPIPLHLDEEYAKTTRFGKLIAPGVMSFMAVWAKFLENDLFGEQLLAGKSTKIEWFAPVFAGDILTGKATVTALTPRNPYNGIAEVTVTAVNREGKTVLSSVTEAVILRKRED